MTAKKEEKKSLASRLSEAVTGWAQATRRIYKPEEEEEKT